MIRTTALAFFIALSGCGPLDYYSGRNMDFYHAG
ncbi:hypothetical protein SAMN05519105_1344 [Rhodobacter sp. 24-YEA-8]|nr:hypothetical protein SAMN05519105_1344 [Rhodobacter sp. 24-YEA-8]